MAWYEKLFLFLKKISSPIEYMKNNQILLYHPKCWEFKPLPQQPYMIDMNLVDTFDPEANSWKRKYLPFLNWFWNLIGSKIEQDELLNYFFRIDPLYYDFHNKGFKYFVENT